MLPFPAHRRILSPSRHDAALIHVRGEASDDTIVSHRARTWLAALGDVLRAMRGDPVLFAPALVIIVLVAVAACLAWRFI